MTKVIEVRDLSKLYRLGEIGTGTISRDINRWWAKARGKEDPYRKIGEQNDRATKGSSEFVWSLRDINFDVHQGDVLGIIGRNGAGKSTLLKILSRITAPTTGSIKTRGRIASLLEVGTGFHPDLTGRENIYLNGAIMGMRKAEVKKKFDAIVDFSGVARYVDTPVKRYSSGMYVRLAFAVAAHLEPEILVVDEVLAVGDAEFQKKCLGKMKDVTEKEGRTVLFVSHNMAAVQNLCTDGIFLKNGNLAAKGSVTEIIGFYFADLQSSGKIKINDHKDVWFSSFYLTDIGNIEQNSIFSLANYTFTIEVTSKIDIQDVYVGIGVNDLLGTRLFTLYSKYADKKYAIKKGKNIFRCSVDKLPLKPGDYFVELHLGNNKGVINHYNDGLKVTIIPPPEINYKSIPDSTQGNLIIQQKWK